MSYFEQLIFALSIVSIPGLLLAMGFLYCILSEVPRGIKGRYPFDCDACTGEPYLTKLPDSTST